MFSRMPLVVDPVLVLAERGTGHDDGAVRELLTAARRIGTPVTAVAAGPGRVAEPAELAELAGLVRRLSPRAVLIPHDTAGEQTAARLAVRLESGLVTDVTGISADEGELHVVQDVAAGACRIATRLSGATSVITVRRGAFPGESPAYAESVARAHSVSPATAATAVPAAPTAPRAARTARILSRRRKRETRRDLVLDTADVVVAGGRGVGSADGFSLLARVAAALGACLGGTHTTCELGWCPDHARISLPGAQIRPRLYLAGGVSGSVRHRAAIRRARTVVAIDEDPAAPIFREADFGIVGDLHEVLPALLDEIARRSTPDAPAPEPPAPSVRSAPLPVPPAPPTSPASSVPPAPSLPSEPAEA
jgi:electron transfer flavoprotein alpha subunit